MGNSKKNFNKIVNDKTNPEDNLKNSKLGPRREWN